MARQPKEWRRLGFHLDLTDFSVAILTFSQSLGEYVKLPAFEKDLDFHSQLSALLLAFQLSLHSVYLGLYYLLKELSLSFTHLEYFSSQFFVSYCDTFQSFRNSKVFFL